MITEWLFKTLDKFPNKLICSDGEIYNLKNGKKYKLKPNWGGYLRLRIYNNSKEVYKWVHRIVYEAFIGDPTGKEIHHRNKITIDNYYLNLEGLSASEHREHHKRYKKYKPEEHVDVPF